MENKYLTYVLLLIQGLYYINMAHAQQRMIISVPVTDLRSKPEAVPQGLQGPAMSKDIGAQDSQCLFGECILAEPVEGNPSWMRVSALGQKAWKDPKWIPYPGFILTSHLRPVAAFPSYNIVLQNLWTPLYKEMSDDSSIIINQLPIGTRLEARKSNADWWEVLIDGKIEGYLKNDGICEIASVTSNQTDQLRKKIIELAHKFVTQGTHYVWGGMSPVNEQFKNQITGIDCSGLSRICYLACGLELPRDSGPQYRAANKITSGKELNEADLIFFARIDEQGTRIGHVVIYIGDGMVIESTGLGVSSKQEAIEKDIALKSLGVRLISVKDLIGTEVADIESGKTTSKDGRYILLGSYFEPENKIIKVKNIALGQDVIW